MTRAFASLFFLTCTPKPLPALSPSQPLWTASSAHFDLYTDVSAEHASKTLETLEQGFDQISAATEFFYFLPRKIAPRIKWDVIALRQASHLSSLINVSSVGGFVANYEQDGIASRVLHIAGTADVRHVLFHELSHAFTDSLLPGAPSWLNEGLAELMSDIQPRGDKLEIARATRRIANLRATGMIYRVPPVAELIDGHRMADGGDQVGNSNYAGATLLVHALYVDPKLADDLPALYRLLLARGNARDWFTPERMLLVSAAYKAQRVADEWTAWQIPMPAASDHAIGEPRLLAAQESLVLLTRLYSAFDDKGNTSKLLTDLRTVASPTAETAYWQWAFDAMGKRDRDTLSGLLALLHQPEVHWRTLVRAARQLDPIDERAEVSLVRTKLEQSVQLPEVLAARARLDDKPWPLLKQCFDLNRSSHPCLLEAYELSMATANQDAAIFASALMSLHGHSEKLTWFQQDIEKVAKGNGELSCKTYQHLVSRSVIAQKDALYACNVTGAVGQVEVEGLIDGEGHLSTVAIKRSNVASADVCLVNVLKHIEFASRPGCSLKLGWMVRFKQASPITVP